MAEEIKVIRVGDILTNLIDPVTKLSVQYSKVLNWYDGTPMTDAKLDSYGIYVKKGSEYFLKSLGEYGQILQKNTMTEMRNLSGLEILLLRMGYYNSVQLNGYYSKGDTPAPIEYRLSDTAETDDGGSVVEVGGVKLEHNFGGEIDVRYYGYNGLSENKQSIVSAASKAETIYINGYGDLGSGISITKNNLTVQGVNSRLTISEESNYAIRVNGDNCTVRGISLNGDNLTQRGVSINGDRPTVEYNTIENVLGRNLSSAGVFIENTVDSQVSSATIRFNRIFNITAPTTGTNGDAVGSARGISFIAYNLDREAVNDISDNILVGIGGREGDGIQILSANGNIITFESSYTRISRNIITNCNRRFIKVQSSDCKVVDNELKNFLPLADLSNSNAGIGIINSNNSVVERNKGDMRGIAHGISVINGSSQPGVGNTIKLNDIDSGVNISWSNPNAQRGMFIQNQKGAVVFQNTVRSNGRVDILSTVNSTISNNIITDVGENMGGEGFNIDAQSHNNTIENNQGFSETSRITYFIAVRGNGNKIRGNTAMYNPSETYSAVRLEGGSDGNVVSENSGYSLSFSGISLSTTGHNYIHPNNQVSFGSTGRSITTSNSVPSSGDYKVGDIILVPPSPSLRRNIGWMCISSSITTPPAGLWIPIGMIGNYSGTTSPEGNQEAERGSLYTVVGSSASPSNLMYLKTTSGGNTGWHKIVTSNMVSTFEEAGIMKQTYAVANVTSPDATDLDTAITLLNELKTQFNASLASERSAGQRVT